MDDNFPSMMRERFELGLGVQSPTLDFTCPVFVILGTSHSFGRHAMIHKRPDCPALHMFDVAGL